MSWIEWVAAGLALAYLLLAVRRSLWCWPFAFASTAIYLGLYGRASLYMQALLQVFYLGMAVYGYLQWKRGADASGRAAIVSWPWRRHVAAILAVLAGSAVNGWIIEHYSQGAAPYLDAFVTWGSVLTTWMVARRVIENWLYWIVVDGVAALVAWQQQLPVTAGLFVLYIGIVVRGYVVWRRERGV